MIKITIFVEWLRKQMQKQYFYQFFIALCFISAYDSDFNFLYHNSSLWKALHSLACINYYCTCCYIFTIINFIPCFLWPATNKTEQRLQWYWVKFFLHVSCYRSYTKNASRTCEKKIIYQINMRSYA